jgi:hypothetical protein
MPPVNMTAQRARNAFVDVVTGAIDRYLFVHESEHWLKRVYALVLKHDNIMEKTEGQRRWGFLYDGVAYRHPDCPVRGQPLRGLHLSLKGEMQELLADHALLLEDRKAIRQGIVGLVKAVEPDLLALRNSLPECVIPALEIFKGLERTGEEGFCLEPGSPAWIQFEKTKEKMEAYSATRLIY